MLKKSGGYRQGSGAKQKYGEKTVQISPFLVSGIKSDRNKGINQSKTF
jgi:hypothetical protein